MVKDVGRWPSTRRNLHHLGHSKDAISFLESRERIRLMSSSIYVSEVCNVKEYSLKFVELSKYTSSLVSSIRDEMSRFVTGVSEDSEEECRVAMLHHKMDLCRLMVHAQQVEEIRWRKRGREGKKPRPSDQAGSNTGRSLFGVQDRPKFKEEL